MTELNFILHEQLEQITVFTPLGIRFWDPVQNTQVSNDLVVTARPESSSRTVIKAFRTASGIYAFQGLPGLHDVEYPTDNLALVTSPPNTKQFIIEVKDKQRRFLPLVFGVDLPLPYKGAFLNGNSYVSTQSSPPTMSPPVSTHPGFYLFSAPTRSVSTGFAGVRGNLVEHSTGRPAAHAILEVEIKGQKTWYGLTDKRGCIAVLFPYPTSNTTLLASPQGVNQIPLNQQQWELAIRIRYSPDSLVFPLNSKIPDLRSIWSQSAGVIWSTCLGSPLTDSALLECSRVLMFGKALILRTEGLLKSELWIDRKA